MYNDIKVSTDKDLDKGKITSIDFDIINHDNAIMYKYFDKSLGYIDQETYGDKIHSGITKDKDRYFFFEHSIINKPSSIFTKNDKSWHSYHIYQITKELFEEIIKDNTFNIWNVKFNSLYHFGEYILSIRRGSYVENLVFYSKLEDDTLTIPYGTSPSDMSRSNTKTIGEFLKWQSGFYPNVNDLKLNKSVFRENILDYILC